MPKIYFVCSPTVRIILFQPFRNFRNLEKPISFVFILCERALKNRYRIRRALILPILERAFEFIIENYKFCFFTLNIVSVYESGYSCSNKYEVQEIGFANVRTIVSN